MIPANDEQFHRKIHWNNIPNLPKRSFELESYFYVLGSSTPTMIYSFNDSTPQLETWKHSKDIVEYLNSNGLDIYLYEPLISYIAGNHKKYLISPGYYEFTGGERTEDCRAKELDSILLYVKTNNLTNVTVRTCDYNAEKYYTYYLPYMKFLSDNIFIKTCNHYFDPITFDKLENKNFLKRRFISLNWRYTKHRHLIASFLINKNSNLSWYYKEKFDVLGTDLYFNFKNWEKTHPNLYTDIVLGSQKLNERSPLCLDKLTKNTTVIDTGICIPMPTIENFKKIDEWFNESFCSIVSESRYAQYTADYSEKTYFSIHHKKPFILVSPPKTLEYLKKDGFKTFSEFWDESYDDEPNHERRMIKILELINHIYNMSDQKIVELQHKIQSVVDYNYDLLKQKRMEYIHKIAFKYYKKK